MFASDRGIGIENRWESSGGVWEHFMSMKLKVHNLIIYIDMNKETISA